ncbi:MAG: peptide-methionine (S)-S-oxide reductase MsrA [Candidatus Pacebacteria bacterium]|nr:peptide-methionine (S)-S-oxide reductase MsrA [Candidatus Paceibacterota bacterium]
MKDDIQKAYFAGGCFWGIEYHFQDLEGVISTRVGYMGGSTEKPTYDEVCAGRTGHVETLEAVFDADKVSFEKLAKLFFEIHDSTQKNRQGPDIGEQYRSVIFYTDKEQREIAEKLIGILKGKGINAVTELVPAEIFYAAEDYHQKYYAKTGKSPYCHIRKEIF